MPQLPVSLPAQIIGKLASIAEDKNIEAVQRGEKPAIRASTIAAQIIKEHFGVV